MARAIIEHVNLTVSDAGRTANLLCDLFGWKVRWRGPAINGGYTYHVGTDDSYIALYAPAEKGDAAPGGFDIIGGLNHVGVIVDDLDAMEKRVVAAGLAPRSHQNYEPGRRFYFYDADGVEYEVASYA